MSNTITSADSIFALTVTNLFPSAQTLEGLCPQSKGILV